MRQPEIVPHARTSDPWTSHAAADRIDEFAGKHCDRILACLHQYGPLTADEIANHIGLIPHQVGRRLPDLHKSLKARPTGDVRPSRSGRMERVWEALP